MTVEKLDYRENYIGNGVTLVFPFNVNYYQDSSIEVYVDREKQSDGYVIDKVNNPVEYDISESISIIFDIPPVDGAEVNIVRKTPNLQPLDFVNGAKLRAETLERGFDLIVMMLQELLGNIGNSLRLDHFSGDGSLLIIKFNAEERADTVLVFDENGEITVVPIDGFPKGDKGDKGDRGDPTDPSSIGLIQLADGTADNVLGFDNLGKPAMFKVNTANIATDAVGSDAIATDAVGFPELSPSTFPPSTHTHSGLNPTGSVIAIAGSSIPTGYVECNGSAVSRTIYNTLYSVIGTIYGIGNGLTTFNIPDLRGEFIRGWDNGRDVDTGRSFGTLQLDDFKSHTHTLPYRTTGLQNPSTLARDAEGVINGEGTGATGGDETRPRNIALMHCIKY